MAELFVVEKDGDNAILRASECPNFASFLAAIRGKFTDLLSDDFPLKFILEPNQLSSVKSQRDFENVILLCQTLQKRVVYLTIPRNCTTANSGTNTLSTPGNENAPTLNRNSKRKLPEEERNEGQCTTSTTPVCNVDPQQESSSPPDAPTEKQISKRKLPEEERNEGECATSSITLYGVAPQQHSGSLLNAPAEKQNSKRKLPEEERNEGECATSRITPYGVAPQQHSGSLLNAPAEKQNSKRKLPEEERNAGEYALNRIALYRLYYVAPQQDIRFLLNAPTEKQKSMMKLPEQERNEGERATSPIPLNDVSPQQDNGSLLSADWANKITHVGQEFRGGVVDFRCQLVKYASKMGFRFRYEKNDAFYIKAICSERDNVGCKWFVKGSISSIDKFTFVIKKANLVHTCTLSVKGTTQRLGQRILGNLVQEKVQTDPKISATQIKDHLLNDYGFDVPYDKVWRAVNAIKANAFGFVSYKDSFTELYWYRNAIIRTNPGSLVTLETEEGTNRFKRFFVAFKGSLQGFKKCRPMLFVDGISMKKQCKGSQGTIFSATAKDGNNGIFPVAFAIVDAENGDNWIWFLSKLRDVIEHEKEIMYLSDRAGGLLSAFNMVWEKPLHFFCLYHLMKYLRGMYQLKKFSDVFKNKMCNLLKDAAYAPNRCLFNTAIAEFQRQGGEIAAHFLTDLPVEKWAVAFAPDLLRYGELMSNAEESFSKWILDLDSCSLPVMYILDCIRTQLMQWFTERRAEQSKWTGALTPKMEEMWNALERLSSCWTISSTTIEGVFNVLSKPPRMVSYALVDVNKRTCTCYQWQVTGFPCCHAVVCINQAGLNIRGVVDACFFNDTYKLIYESNIEAIPTREKNEDVDPNTPPILPPVTRKNTGRPSEKRVLSKGEERRKKFHCGRCGEVGTHLWVTCSDALE